MDRTCCLSFVLLTCCGKSQFFPLEKFLVSNVSTTKHESKVKEKDDQSHKGEGFLCIFASHLK